MTRNELKKIIKECLVEILAEGVGQAIVERAAIKRQPTQNVHKPVYQTRTHVSEHMQVQQKSHVPSIVNTVTKDPVLASILADTANTTLIQQNESRQSMPHGRMEQLAASYDPGEIIGAITGVNQDEQHAKWAQAAFAPSRSLPGHLRDTQMDNFDPYLAFTSGK